MNIIKFILVVSIVLVSANIFTVNVYGLTDKNNNGRDDMAEDANKLGRYINCMILMKTWNGTDCHERN